MGGLWWSSPQWGRNFRSPSWLVTSVVVARSDATIDCGLLHHDPASVSTHIDEIQVDKRGKGNEGRRDGPDRKDRDATLARCLCRSAGVVVYGRRRRPEEDKCSQSRVG